MFHLGWFMGLGFGAYGWNQQWSGNVAADVGRPGLFVEAATTLERAGFDYIMLEDSSVLPDIYEGRFDSSLKAGIIRFDPLPLVSLLTRRTHSIGVIATMSTTFYPPFMAARLMATLDHITHGRVGVNLVTSSPHAAAKNYGMDALPQHDLRYDMAAEWMRVVRELWESWEEDALVADAETGTYVRPGSVAPINFEGRFHRSRGPLNILPSPQRRPVVCQAGGSPAGRELAAEHADTIVSAVVGVEAMKEFRDDMTRRLEARGRDPKAVKILFLVDPILADTDARAQELFAARHDDSDAAMEGAKAGLSYVSGFDMSKFELDAPFPDLSTLTNGHQSTVADYQKSSSGKTLRQVLADRRTSESIPLAGTPATVADQMEEAMAYSGGDGFLVASMVTRRNLTLVADGLCPELRRRGLIRNGYVEGTFRDNLTAY